MQGTRVKDKILAQKLLIVGSYNGFRSSLMITWGAEPNVDTYNICIFYYLMVYNFIFWWHVSVIIIRVILASLELLLPLPFFLKSMIRFGRFDLTP